MRFMLIALLASCGSAPPPANAVMNVAGEQGRVEVTIQSLSIQSLSSLERGVCELDYMVTDATTRNPLDGEELTVVPWMPAHGHGTSVPPTVTPMGGGHYRITNVYFFMPGTWELRTTLRGSVADQLVATVDVR